MADATDALLHELARNPKHNPHDIRVRVAVAGRANGRCEYCLLPTGGQFQIDHIVPPRSWGRYVAGSLPGLPPLAGRGGPHHLDNFAWCCPFCNQAKSHRTTAASRNGARLYDRRQDDWADHFAFIYRYIYILGITPIGEATVAALDLNDRRLMNHVGPRHAAILNGNYPPEWALDLLIPM